MSDNETTVGQLRDMVRQFVEARDWQQFHAPKNISMSIAVEAAELMEHFQWLTVEASRGVAGDVRRCGKVAEELADVLCYALALANEMDIDVATAMREKMAKNERKYPASDYRGRYE